MDDPKNNEKRPWTAPLKHVGLGGGIMTAVFWFTPMKKIFYTREEGAANSAQIEELKGIVKEGFARQESNLFAHTTEETHKHERMMDILRGELKEEKSDRIRELNFVENVLRIKKTQTN